jgi:branched-chain amino acid transport system ATP-binding protein
MSPPLLRVNEIQAEYGRLRALHDVSLEVPEGSIVALLGANGAGKTTTLRAISGVLHPTRGTIEFDGKRIERMCADQLVRLGIAHVPEGRQVFPELTVYENLRLGAYTRRDARAIDKDLQRVLDYFPRLRERLAQTAGTLSGGEQQMLAIGRGLMAKPRLLLLDEPSLGLAPLLVKEIFHIIAEIRAAGTTVVLVEQNAHMALNVADYAYLLRAGRVVLSDSRYLLSHPVIASVFCEAIPNLVVWRLLRRHKTPPRNDLG